MSTALVQAYLTNIQQALQNLDVVRAQALIEHALKLVEPPCTSLPFHHPMQIASGVGLDTGIQRKDKPNEDFAFAATGCIAQTQDTYGVFIVADGMGGHAHGQIASRLAIETIADHVVPLVQNGQVQGAEIGNVLVDAVHQANQAIYARNEATNGLLDQMGTTITAAVTVGAHAFVVNVGDSRTYLYRPQTGLRALTRDHSLVAELVATGAITAEEIYTHPDRNKITRCVGATSRVEVDLFYEQLQDGDILLLCSDGLWEMTRPPDLETILASSWLSAAQMAERLVHLALRGGGLDNIGLIVAQCQINVVAMETMIPLSQYTGIVL